MSEQPSISPSESTSQNQRSTRAKQRILSPCVNCRRRKRKCSGDKPVCGFCAKNDLQCEWTMASKRGPRKGYIEQLEHRASITDSALAIAMAFMNTIPAQHWPPLFVEGSTSPGENTTTEPGGVERDLESLAKQFTQLDDLSELSDWYRNQLARVRLPQSEISSPQHHHSLFPQEHPQPQPQPFGVPAFEQQHQNQILNNEQHSSSSSSGVMYKHRGGENPEYSINKYFF